MKLKVECGLNQTVEICFPSLCKVIAYEYCLEMEIFIYNNVSNMRLSPFSLMQRLYEQDYEKKEQSTDPFSRRCHCLCKKKAIVLSIVA